ncbi:MAG: hypothetical protein ACI3YC_08315 [Alloprevotella sp.]
MKKTYMRPLSEVCPCHLECMLSGSLGVTDSEVNSGNKSDDDYNDYGSQFSSRRSWPPRANGSIWE